MNNSKQGVLVPVKEKMEWKPDVTKSKRKKTKRQKKRQWPWVLKKRTITKSGGRAVIGVPQRFMDENMLSYGGKYEWKTYKGGVAYLTFETVEREEVISDADWALHLAELEGQENG